MLLTTGLTMYYYTPNMQMSMTECYNIIMNVKYSHSSSLGMCALNLTSD